MLYLLILAVLCTWLFGQFVFAVAAIIVFAVFALVILGKLFNIYDKVKERRVAAKFKQAEDDRNDHLRDLLNQVDHHQEVINSSNDVEEIEAHMESLLVAMDEIMSYSEKFLQEAGMTKSTMPQQKQYITQCYQAALERAKKKRG